MKYKILFFSICLSVNLYSQTRHVLLEEFTGAHCGQCPMGSYFADSMLTQYPGLIVVALHAYTTPDAMDFPTIDTLFNTYSQGAPLANIDRINPGGASNNTAQYQTLWDSNIQSRLSVTPSLEVSISPSWNSGTRNITAQISVDILSNMPTGDYRIGLYVVEDSVTGTGSGYDQSNVYDGMPGNPFYGMGDPIVGYTHRHVVRALLPHAWGQAGIIPATPTMGMNFMHTINYTLPVGMDENQVHLVAFVYNYTATHQGDEIMNAIEEKLISTTSSIPTIPDNMAEIYPNPNKGCFNLSFQWKNQDTEISIFNADGKNVYSEKLINFTGSYTKEIDISENTSGVYYIKITQGKDSFFKKMILE